jgi:hypothetical protein
VVGEVLPEVVDPPPYKEAIEDDELESVGPLHRIVSKLVKQ